MRALCFVAASALALAGCETAFVGRAPGGRYVLVEVDGRAPPQVSDSGNDCPTTIAAGHIDLDSLARRFDLVLEQRNPCMAGGGTTSRATGTYLRRSGRIEVETSDGNRLVATETGNTLSLNYFGSRLRFRQAAPQR
jgi:hypothetical protein